MTAEANPIHAVPFEIERRLATRETYCPYTGFRTLLPAPRREMSLKARFPKRSALLSLERMFDRM